MSNRFCHIALIGCGRWGRNILRDLIDLGCTVTVIDPSADHRQAAQAMGATLVLPEVRDLGDVDGIVVASPTTSHLAVIDLLSDRQVPIYVEKPLTNDAQAAQALAARTPQDLYVMDKWRYHPGIECLRDIVSENRLGAIRGLRTTRTQPQHLHEDVDAIWILAPHDLSIALEVLGFIPAVQAAEASFTDGAPCGLIATLGDDPWHILEVSGCHIEQRRAVHVYCEEGIAALHDPYADHVSVTRFTPRDSAIDSRTVKIGIDAELPLRRELKAFLTFIKGGPPPKSNILDASAIVATIAELRARAGLQEG